MTTTDISMWRSVAANEVSSTQWLLRSQLIAHFVRPGDTVLDLGAGDRKLRALLPSSCGYIPVDCTAELPGTFVVDFNREFRLPEDHFDIIVSAGFLEYLEDLNGFLANLSKAARGRLVIFSYSYTSPRRRKNARKPWRKLNAFADPEGLTKAVRPHLESVREVARLKKQSLFIGRLGEPLELHAQLPVLNDLLRTRRFFF